MLRPLVAAVAVVLLTSPGAARAATVVNGGTPRPAAPAPTTVARTGPRDPTRGATAPATPNAARAPLAGARRRIQADSIVVEKSLRRLTLYANDLPLRTYDVALGRAPDGAKVQVGDFRTPEGLYYIDARNPQSQFYRGLHVSYPNAQDVARARAAGVSTGGDIMIHGLPNGQGQIGGRHRANDWTSGCVAVTNEEIEEIWDAVPVGTPVRIVP
jgi:lipoprotein-anchoring transpeptidase ErfK/SrfK